MYSDIFRVFIKNFENYRLSAKSNAWIERWLGIQVDHIFEKLNSFSFPGYFKLFPWAAQKKKIQWAHFCWQSCHMFFIFLEFSRFFYKSSNFPEFSLRFWHFFEFPEFSGSWPPWNCWTTVSGTLQERIRARGRPWVWGSWGGGQLKGWELEAFPTFPCKWTITAKNCACWIE